MMCCSCLTFQIDMQKVKLCMTLKKQTNTYILIIFCQYLIPPACYNWESTILCSGSQHCLRSTMHRFNTYIKYVTVRLLSVGIYMWMWRWLQENQPAINCKIWVPVWPLTQAIYNAAGFFCLFHHTYLSKLCDISETLCYLGILGRVSDSQNLTLEKLYCLHEPGLLVSSRMHILAFSLLFPRQPLQVPPELLLLCSLIKMYMLPLADLSCVNSINFHRCDID